MSAQADVQVGETVPEMGQNLYVVGHPVAHSKSPAMHNAAFAALGLPWHYGRLDCASAEEAAHFIQHGEWLALNVTMPYKPLALQLADCPSPYAVAAQGANVLIRTGSPLQLHADNTDGRGCVWFLERSGISFEDAQVVVCGSGPTSQSIMYAAAEAGASRVWLCGRNKAKVERALNEFLQRVGEAAAARLLGTLRAGSYDEPAATRALAAADVIIDATPLGMCAGDPAPFDMHLLHEGQTVLDVVYGQGETALMSAARAAGCAAFDGSGMLVAQAVLTLYDIGNLLEVPMNLEDCDLFDVMARGAGFMS